MSRWSRFWASPCQRTMRLTMLVKDMSLLGANSHLWNHQRTETMADKPETVGKLWGCITRYDLQLEFTVCSTKHYHRMRCLNRSEFEILLINPSEIQARCSLTSESAYLVLAWFLKSWERKTHQRVKDPWAIGGSWKSLTPLEMLHSQLSQPTEGLDR